MASVYTSRYVAPMPSPRISCMVNAFPETKCVCGCVCVCVCVCVCGGELLEVRRSHNSLGPRDPKRIVRAQKLSLGTRHDANVEQVPKESQLHSHYTFTSVNMIISSNIHAVLVDQNSSIEARYCFLSCQFLLTHLF